MVRPHVAMIIAWLRVSEFAFAFACTCALGYMNVAHGQSDAFVATDDTMTVNPRWCRSGAFLDAMVMMNASMRAHGALSASDAAATRIATAELGAILNIALKQAVAEYHCIEGKLPLSYAQNYGDTLRRAIATGKQIRVATATIESADTLLAQLDVVAERQRAK